MINLRYQILNKVGEGRSQVFKALDTYNESYVALKILSKVRPAEEHRLLREEFFVLSKLSHPNIINAYEYGIVSYTDTDDWNKYRIAESDSMLVLEYFDSLSLDNYLDKIDDPALLKLIREIASVLQYLHNSNLVYTDLKPENILISNLDEPTLKLVDFDLVSVAANKGLNSIRGSSFFLAPEVLKREGISYASDLYSLGVLIYRILYKKFPFSSFSTIHDIKLSLEAYKEIQDSIGTGSLNEVVKKALNTSPEKRPASCIHFLHELGLELKTNTIEERPPSIYYDRNNLLSNITAYLGTKDNIQPIEISGSVDSGKSTLLKKLENDSEDIILITKEDIDYKQSFFFVLINKLCSNGFLHKNLSTEIKSLIKSLLTHPAEITFQSANRVISKISEKCSFTLLLDDFNDYDSITRENIIKLVPLLISKGIHVLIAFESETVQTTPLFLKSVRINIDKLSDSEVEEFLKLSLSPLLPIDEIARIIHTYSDSKIGTIARMVTILISSKYLRINKSDRSLSVEADCFEKELLEVDDFELENSLLKTSEVSSSILYLLCVLNRELSYEDISDIFTISIDEVRTSIRALSQANLVKGNALDEKCRLLSERIRLAIEAKTSVPNSFYIRIAKWMIKHRSDFNAFDIASQFENGDDLESSFQYYFVEYTRAISNSAFNYAVRILEHTLSLNLPSDKQVKTKYELSKTYFKIGMAKECISEIESLLILEIDKDLRTELLILKGENEIAQARYQAAINIFHQLIDAGLTQSQENKILISLADANLYLGNFSITQDISMTLLDFEELELADKGKVHNLLALVCIYRDRNYEEAIFNLQRAIEFFEASNQIDRVSGMKINLGGIYAMQADYENAKLNWNEALLLNQSVGNLEQEAKLLLNYGVLSFDLCEYETAKEQYMKSLTIFESAGDLNSIGLAYLNLGEVNSAQGQFEDAEMCFTKSEEIFKKIGSFAQLSETLFALGKHYFLVGNITLLAVAIKQYTALISDNLISTSDTKYIKLLDGLICLLENKSEMAEQLLGESIKNFSANGEREDQINYHLAFFALVNCLIIKRKLVDAKSLLDGCIISKTIPQKNIYDSEKELYLGLIAYKSQKDDPTIHLSNCITLLADSTLNLICVKAFYIESMHYTKRGNIYKANKLAKISDSIIDELSFSYLDKTKQSNFKMHMKFLLECLNN